MTRKTKYNTFSAFFSFLQSIMFSLMSHLINSNFDVLLFDTLIWVISLHFITVQRWLLYQHFKQQPLLFIPETCFMKPKKSCLQKNDIQSSIIADTCVLNLVSWLTGVPAYCDSHREQDTKTLKTQSLNHSYKWSFKIFLSQLFP